MSGMWPFLHGPARRCGFANRCGCGARLVNQLLYLIGYRGTGKTTVGRRLAERIGWNFLDADVVLEANAGTSIKEIFAAEAEAGFRDREAQNLRELSTRTQCIIATGGGIVLRDENRHIV